MNKDIFKAGFKKGSPSELKARAHLRRKHKVLYHSKYDLIFCKDCDKWIEDFCRCDESECPFPKPKGRPSDG